MKHSFPAIIEPAGAGFSAFFPDLPGCTATGDSSVEVLRALEISAQLYIDDLIEDGEAIPKNDDARLAEARQDPDITVDMVAMIPVRGPAKSKRISLTIDEDLLADIDAVADNRSAFLAAAARVALAGEARRSAKRDVTETLEAPEPAPGIYWGHDLLGGVGDYFYGHSGMVALPSGAMSVRRVSKVVSARPTSALKLSSISTGFSTGGRDR